MWAKFALWCQSSCLKVLTMTMTARDNNKELSYKLFGAFCSGITHVKISKWNPGGNDRYFCSIFLVFRLEVYYFKV